MKHEESYQYSYEHQKYTGCFIGKNSTGAGAPSTNGASSVACQLDSSYYNGDVPSGTYHPRVVFMVGNANSIATGGLYYRFQSKGDWSKWFKINVDETIDPV